MASNCKCTSSCKCVDCECVGFSCTSDVYDVIVVGAGVMGSSTAYQLAKQGKKVLLLEKFSLSHKRGSSHGASRAYNLPSTDLHLAEIVPTAIKMWKTLESESGSTLLKQTGRLNISSSRSKIENIVAVVSSVANSSIPGVLSHDELQQHFPMMPFDPSDNGCYEGLAGTLLADRCRNAFQHVFLDRGGILLDNEEVVDIAPGETIRVKTTKDIYKTHGVVLSCGPWSSKFLGTLNLKLPLQCEATQVCYWKRRDGSSVTDKMAAQFIVREDDLVVYGLPENEYDGLMKICLHYGVKCDPDHMDLVDQKEEARQMESLKKFVKKKFPSLIPEPVIQERCIYTVTPDKRFIIDRHPVHKNIVYAAGFSGMGFKYAPVVGVMMADMLQQKQSIFHAKELRANRFLNSKL